MRETPVFALTPPLRMAGGPIIRTVDDAAQFIRGHSAVRDPLRRDGVLHRLEGAKTVEEEAIAAEAFRAWAEGEGLVFGFAE